MQKKALFKTILKEISSSKSRFLSILFLIMLGVGFFSGLKSAGPDMLNTANSYFTEQNLMDLKVQSTMGLDKSDIDELKKINGVDIVEPIYSKDVLIGREGMLLKLISYNKNNELNKYVIESGRLPEKDGEIALDSKETIKNSYKIGDKIKFSYDNSERLNDEIKDKTYEIVGFVKSPMYIGKYERGTSNIGKGRVDGFGVISESEFKMPVYTEAYLTFNNLKGLNSYSEKYDELLNNNKKEVEDITKNQGSIRLDDIKKEANDKILKSKNELKKAKDELKKAEDKLNESKNKLDEGKEKYNQNLSEFNTKMQDAKEKLDSSKNQLNDKNKQLENNLSDLKAKEVKLLEGKKQLENNLNDVNNKINQLKPLFNKVESILKVPVNTIPDNIKKQLVESLKKVPLKNGLSLGDVLEGYFSGKVEANVVSSSMNSILDNLEKAKSNIEKSQEEINTNYKKLKDGIVKINGYKKELDKGLLTIKEKELEYNKGKQVGLENFKLAKEKLDEGEKQYKEGLTKFNTEKVKAEKKIKDGEKEIKKGEENIKDIKVPDYYIFSRSDNLGYSEYQDNADRISALSKIFPLFFFAIAALVSLTTVTRMIEEQRIQLGTLKALGYSSFDISLKYLVYATTASLVGSFVGLLIGYELIPRIVYNAYSMLYNFPDLQVSYYLSYALVSIAIAIACTGISAYIVLREDLKSTPATLMRPKAPKSGKRILLERIKPVWKRFNFIEKVTARNIFRYKDRMLMTVLGIAGCMALIITGFGIKSSVSDLGKLQFGKIVKYNAMVIFNKDVSNEDTKSYEDVMKNLPEIQDRLDIYQEQVKVQEKGVNPQEVVLMVPKNENNLNQFITLDNRKTDEEYTLNSNGSIISEKLAKLFKIKKGDMLKFKTSDNKTFEVKVSEIAENYAGHYIYMSKELYREIFNKDPKYNAELLKYKYDTKFEEQLSEKLSKESKVLNVSYNGSIESNFEDSMSSLNIVVVVLIISAAILAFIVLYNLTNINVSERIRELSTIKVLGFYDNEVTMYIYRENIILTIMGIIVGGFLGKILHIYVLSTAEMDNMMFNPSLHWSSFVYAGILTIIFSSIVMFIMHIRLKKVNMIEALKSNE